MPDYVLLFRGGDAAETQFSPQEMQAYMGRWFAWVEKMRSEGIFKGGEPLRQESRIVEPDKTVTDGPFAESKEMIGGYVAIDVPDIDTAAENAKDCPILEVGGRVEVRPVADLEKQDTCVE